MKNRKPFILFAIFLVAVMTASLSYAELEIYERNTKTVGSTIVSWDSSFHNLTYTSPNTITMTVSWAVDHGAATFNAFVLKAFSPKSKKDPVLGQLIGINLLKDSNNGEGEVEVSFKFTELKHDVDRDIGNAHFTLRLNVDKNGDGIPERVVGYGVNVHVEEIESEIVEVPDVVGIAQAAAEGAIAAASLTVGTVSTANSDTVPVGNVIGQDPASGASVALGSQVNLVVSLGPAMATVPGVVGMTQANAEATIAAASLTVGTVTTANSDTVPVGNVIGQDPASGASVALGSQVNLVVSLGPAMATVPGVVGMTQANAEATIAAASLTVGTVTTANSDTVPVGNVIGQDPASGASVALGSQVNLVVSLGPVMATVPDVVGMAQANAASAIVAADLTVGTVSTANSDTVAAGNVISQNPTAGTSVAPNSAVDLVVSLGPASGELPPDPVDVAPEVDPTVATDLFAATEFLYTGTNPIQTGVDPITIEANRVAILRGKVMNRDREPLPGVTITILNHPEYGQTLSREDGMFDLAVNGGGYLIINYTKAGYLTAQRQVNVPWQDWVWAPDVALIPLEPTVTAVDLTQTSEDFIVAQGSMNSDDNGLRRATLLFPQGTQAELVMPDGSMQPISTLNFRATEYSVGPNGPKAMPAELPPGIGYTYCVEFSVDEALAAGATTVNFSQPLINYVENFMGFATGGEVPAYYYDKKKGAWQTSQNGLVIKIVGESAGLAELDTDGDDVADDPAVLATLGITDAERLQLAALYATGQSLWRVPVSHFSTVDYNYPPDYTPDEYPPPLDVSVDSGEDQPCTSDGSIIECQNQTLGKSVSIVGTPFSLNYRSARAEGNRTATTLNIPISGNPGLLLSIELEIYVAGQQFKQSFPPDTNQEYTFTWDGKDSYGRDIQGGSPILVRLGYKYMAKRCDGLGRCVYVPYMYDLLWSEWKGSVGVWDAKSLGLGGWTLDEHHFYDPSAKTLWLGNGDKRSAQYSQNYAIVTVAGNNTEGYSGDGGPATQAQLSGPKGFSFGPDGSLYIADQYNNRIRKVDPYGIISTVAGSSEYAGFSGDGGPAINALLANPTDVEVGPDGSLYIHDESNWRIRKVDPEGIITTIAGNGEWETCDYPFDMCNLDGPATETPLANIHGMSIGIDSSIYLSAYYTNEIIRIRPDGILTHVIEYRLVGGYDGDGGPAVDALIRGPSYAVQAPDGSLYINDRANYRVRKISPDGIITTVAGNGILGPSSGDGGPATEAQFYTDGSAGLALGLDGSLYIPDTYTTSHSRIRRVGPDGIINTVVGTGVKGYSPDGTPATRAMINNVHHTEVGPDGNLYFNENPNFVIRKVASTFSGFSFTDILIASLDGTKLYEFNPSGKHMRTINSITGSLIYEFFYDGEGFLVAIEDAYGNVTNIERDFDGNPTAIVSPYGQTTTLSQDSNGFLDGITNPADETWQFNYTADGLLTSSNDPNSNTSAYTYDDLGRLILAEDAGGGSQTLDRTALENGYEVTRTTEMGRITTYQVEQLPNGDTLWLNTAPSELSVETLFKTDGSQTITHPDGTITTILQGPDPRFGMQAPLVEALDISTPGGLNLSIISERTVSLADENDLFSLQTLTDTTNINGRNLITEYDATTRTLTKTTPQGRTKVDTFNEQQLLVKSIVTGLEPTQITYDADGRITIITQGTDAAARDLSIAYNTNGFLSSITDPMLRSVDFAYDAAGRITRQTLPGGREILFGYDAIGNIISITPPGLPAHNFVYTPVDSLEEYTPPDLGATPVATTYVYNLDRQLTRIQRPDGATLDIAYDSAGRVSTKTLPRGTVGYAYDGTSGALSSITAPGGETLSFVYDGSFLTERVWSGTITGSIEQTYDNNFHIVSRSVNGAHTIAFTYDQDGLLTQAGSLSISRDSGNGYINGITLGSAVDSRSYNGFGELLTCTASYGGSTRFAAQYTRDKLGRITDKTETVEGTTNTHTYMYDTAGRLTQVAENGSTVESYVYDDNGNRLSANGVSATHDDQDRLIQSGTTTYTYTANGDLYTKTVGTETTTYTYDVLGNLTRVILPDTTQIDYIIDGINRRIGKKVNGGLVQGFLYKDQLNPIAELDSSNTIVSRFIYGSKPNVPDYMIMGANTYRIISDHLGSPRLVIDIATGTTAQRLDYDAFGNVITDTNPGFQPFGFAGGLYDPDTGLTQFGARDYDAETGRWTVKDPILFAGGNANLYGYVMNDPVNLIDPTGYFPPALIAAIPLIIAAAPEVIDFVASYGSEMDVIDTGPGWGVGSQVGGTTGTVIGRAVNELMREYSAYIELQSAQQLSDLYDRLIREQQEREILQLMDEIRELLYGCD